MRHEVWDGKGNLLSVEEVPDPETPPLTPEQERLAAVEDAIDTLLLDALGGA